MKIETHRRRIIDELDVALPGNKADIVCAYRSLLPWVGRVFKSEMCAFWYQQLTQTEIQQIPMTKRGVAEARHQWAQRRAAPRSKAEEIMLDLAECLFTYWDEDDLCRFQTPFHYYYHIPSTQVFKESELGVSTLAESISHRDDEVRIARLSELAIESGKLF